MQNFTKHKKNIIIIILVVIVSLIIYNYFTATIDMTINENLTIPNKNNKSQPKKITLYHSKNCGHCIIFLPEWKKLYNNAKIPNNVIVNDIECSNNNKCANINAFPTVILTVNDKNIEYNGQRTENALVDFINSN